MVPARPFFSGRPGWGRASAWIWLFSLHASPPRRDKAPLPAPDAGLRLAGSAHDLDRAEAAGRKQHDLGPPGMLLRGVAVADDRFQAAAIEGAEGDGDTGAHAPDSHAPNRLSQEPPGLWARRSE